MTRYALVVGIEEYDNGHLNSLSKSVADAEDFAELLEKYGNCPHNHISLKRGRVSIDELVQAIKTFLNEQARNQEAIIYFSGHGVLEEIQDQLTGKVSSKGYLAASDCQLKKEGDRFIINNKNAIPLQSITSLINETELSSLVFILDACHSGALIKEIDNSFNIFQNNTTYYFLAACQSYEDSWARKNKRHSEFTGALLDALSQDRARADEDGIVTAGQAFERVEKILQNSRQKPTFLGKGSSFPLVTYPVTSLFKENTSQSGQISDDDIKILKPYLQLIDRYVLAWAVMEGISVYALKQWLDSDQSLGIESFLSVVREKFDKQPDGTSSLISVLKTLVNHPTMERQSNTQEKIIQWLQRVKPGIVLENTINLNQLLKAYLFVVIEQEDDNDSLSLTAQLKIENKDSISLNVQPNQKSSYQSRSDRPGVVIGELSEDDKLEEKIYPYLRELLFSRCDYYLLGIPNSNYELVIEIFLPFDYLAESVDLWSIKMKKLYRKGTYRVIVRSYERLRYSEYKKSLIEVWERMKTIDKQDLSNYIKRLEEKQNYNYADLTNEIRKQRSIGLSFLLPEKEDREELFFALLTTGVPLAFWLRSRGTSELSRRDPLGGARNIEGDYLDYFNRLLCANCLQQDCERLIEELFKLRQQAHENSQPEKRWGYYAALLLDNPDRTPSLNFLKFGQ